MTERGWLVFEKQKRLNRIEAKLEKLDVFPGSLQDYNDLKGKKHCMLDTGTPSKSVNIFGSQGSDSPAELFLIEKLINEGCVGFIYCSDWRGVPIKRL